ncbi:MAG: UDP-N-acetylglucosamine 1-carboxyvinyltransferase [Candidatus Pacebacteria bacterium]|nr:UDP-N-acetylglucosamine 1-carboxyvinyltransferase [Candidatus Paceibacterota bacterium]
MRDQFLIEGLGNRQTLRGSIPVRGSKNGVLPVMAASLLFKHPLRCLNVPDIEDINRMSELLFGLGAPVEKIREREYRIHGNKASLSKLETSIAKRFRASIILTGPLLARFGKVTFPFPGGCVIGKRPIDLFLEGFKKMGASVTERNEQFTLTVPKKLVGADIFFKIQSVTATETFLLAAVLAKGVTTLRNVALEPEVTSLAEFLSKSGVKIKGIGTSTLSIEGGGLLSSLEGYTTIPDRIETGSFLILGALTSNDLTITSCNPESVRALIETLKECGVLIEERARSIHIRGWKGNTEKSPKDISIRTHEYPGFPTDLQAPFVVFLTQMWGEGVVFETIFEGRLGYTEDLKQMGASITLWDAQRALVKGKTVLKGMEVNGPDIRAGLAFIIAAIVAKGRSVINNVYYVDRGYERLENRLRDIGVSITRINGETGEQY